jgi:hypothetical protein
VYENDKKFKVTLTDCQETVKKQAKKEKVNRTSTKVQERTWKAVMKMHRSELSRELPKNFERTSQL